MTFLLILFGALEGLIKKKFELRRAMVLMGHGRANLRPETFLGRFLSQRRNLTLPFFRLRNPGNATDERGAHVPAHPHPLSGRCGRDHFSGRDEPDWNSARWTGRDPDHAHYRFCPRRRKNRCRVGD